MNVFDLAQYVALHALAPLSGLQCVTPFPNASALEWEGEVGPFLETLVCHEPKFAPYNVTIGPAPEWR